MAETTTMNMIQALNQALDLYMERDERAVILGEDVGHFGGVFRVTQGLQDKYGSERVFDTPLAECEKHPPPPVESLFEDVLATPGAQLTEQRDEYLAWHRRRPREKYGDVP